MSSAKTGSSIRRGLCSATRLANRTAVAASQQLFASRSSWMWSPRAARTLFPGAHGFAGEIAHLRVDDD
jgi:hypothetical protein